MLNRSLRPLHERLDTAHDMMSRAHSTDEFIALGNYIGNLYSSLVCMGDKHAVVEPIICFGSKKRYKSFLKELDVYSDEAMQQFVLKKDYHCGYIGSILPAVEKECDILCPMTFDTEEPLTRKQFREIFFSFLDSIQMTDMFKEMVKNKQIHSSYEGIDKGILGFTLFNPVNGDLDLFVKDFHNTLNHMSTLAHELGHGYDLKHFDGTIKEYNQYFYISFFGEVISRLMERLLHRFLIRNRIIVNSAKDSFVNFEDLNHDYLLKGYILSLLEASILLSHEFCECDSEDLIKMIKKHFLEEANLRDYVKEIQRYDITDTYTYLYGDILSLFLCEEIEQNGMNNDLMEYFMKHRTEPFQEEMMMKNGLNPSGYIKLYKKEVNLIKK